MDANEIKRLKIENALLRHAAANGKRLDDVDLKAYTSLLQSKAAQASDGEIYFDYKPLDRYIADQSKQGSRAWQAFTGEAAPMPTTSTGTAKGTKVIRLEDMGKLSGAELQAVRRGEIKVLGREDEATA